MNKTLWLKWSCVFLYAVRLFKCELAYTCLDIMERVRATVVGECFATQYQQRLCSTWYRPWMRLSIRTTISALRKARNFHESRVSRYVVRVLWMLSPLSMTIHRLSTSVDCYLTIVHSVIISLFLMTWTYLVWGKLCCCEALKDTTVSINIHSELFQMPCCYYGC